MCGSEDFVIVSRACHFGGQPNLEDGTVRMKFWASIMLVAVIGCGSGQKSDQMRLEEYQKKAAAAKDEAELQRIEEEFEKEKAANRK
jgi:hypothetical protein